MVRPTTNGQYLHVAAVTRPSLVAKLKSDENGHVLNAASDTLPCFVDVFTFFLKMPITFCFTNILFHFENENWYHSQFHLPGINPQKKNKLRFNGELTEKNNQNKQDLTEKAKKIHYKILMIS